jgi:hypothetical protein
MLPEVPGLSRLYFFKRSGYFSEVPDADFGPFRTKNPD